MEQIDSRIVKVTVQVNNQLKTYTDLEIVAKGTKFANANQNECEIKITNLEASTRDYLLSETSPFNKNRTPKIFTLEAGRQSYGTTLIFSGNITSSYLDYLGSKEFNDKRGGSSDDSSKSHGTMSSVSSQPPDIGIVLKCLTGDYQKGNIIARSQPGLTKLSNIAQQIASDLNLALNFQATDKMISNYNFSGAALKQVNLLGTLGNIDAFIDNDVLIVKNFKAALTNRIKVLNAQSGMIGIPELTEQGVRVRFLIDNVTTLGGKIRLDSKIYPNVNGDYTIYKLGFEITNRDVPFYWIAEAAR